MHLLQLPVNADGRCILLRAPRAGYGKSHLLSRVQSLLGSSHEFILLQPTDGYRMDANAALNDVISKLTLTLPGGAGLSEFDLLARKIFALGLGSLVRSGEVPCQDRETTLAALQNRPVETFDFHHHTAVTAHWARNHFAILRPLLIVEIAKIIAAPLREVSFWVDALFRYAVTPLDQPSRSGMLMEAVVDASATAPMNERLATLLKMLTQWQRVILVADELEGMSVNAEAALRFAAFLTKLRLGAERVDMIISVNDDIWESAFVPRLSGGLGAFAKSRPSCKTRAIPRFYVTRSTILAPRAEHCCSIMATERGRYRSNEDTGIAQRNLRGKHYSACYRSYHQ